MGFVQSRELGACGLRLPRFILQGSFSDNNNNNSNNNSNNNNNNNNNSNNNNIKKSLFNIGYITKHSEKFT